MTVYLLVDGIYYPGAFSSQDRAKVAKRRWADYTGREAQIAALTVDDFALDKYERKRVNTTAKHALDELRRLVGRGRRWKIAGLLP